jgi:DNA-directed RNA polymerase beta' subunit
MKLDLLNHEIFIQRNGLKEVTTTDIYSTARAVRFSDTGLWSESIFGLVGSKERQRKFGWIDLKTKIIHPIVYNMMITLHPSIRQYILGSKFFSIKDGLLVEDNVEGKSGILNFIKNVDQIDFMKNHKLEKQDIAKYLETNKKNIIIDKFLVYPAGIRDIHETRSRGARVQQLSEINDNYIELLKLTAHLFLAGDNDILALPTVEKMQKILIQITTWGKTGLKGKSGLFRSNILNKTTDYSARLVIVSSPNIPLGQLGIPYHICLLIFEPFFFHQVLRKNEKLKILIADFLNRQPQEISMQVLQKFMKNMTKQHKTYPPELHNVLVDIAELITKNKQVLYKRDPVKFSLIKSAA